MSGMLDGQVAVITGAGRGIGASAAKLMAGEGARILLSDIDPEPAEAVADEIRAAGGEAAVHAGDVTDTAFPEALMKAAADAFGKITIVVNNAGYTWDGVIHKMTDEQWHAIIDCHVGAPFRIARATVPYMRDVAKQEMASGGKPQPRCIINVSSTSGLHGNAGQINYATAKMGVVGMTKTIAKEWGQFNIRCNAVAYGSIEAMAEDGAAMCEFYAWFEAALGHERITELTVDEQLSAARARRMRPLAAFYCWRRRSRRT